MLRPPFSETLRKVGCTRPPFLFRGDWGHFGPVRTPSSTFPGPSFVCFVVFGGSWVKDYRCVRSNRLVRRYEFIGLGAIDVTKPFRFTLLGGVTGPQPYKFIGVSMVRWASISQTPVLHGLSGGARPLGNHSSRQGTGENKG